MAIGDQSQTPLPEDFYRGVNFLGNPTQVSLVGQEPGTPATGLSAGGAPIGTLSAPGGASGAAPPSGGSNTLGLALQALGLGQKGASFAQQLRALQASPDPNLQSLAADLSGSLVDTGGLGASLGGSTTLLPDLALQGSPTQAQELANLFSGSLVSPYLNSTGLEGLSTSGALGTGEAAGAGAGSGLGTAAGGAGLVAALLGLLASQTGNRELGQAATAAGGAATLGTLASGAGTLAAGGAAPSVGAGLGGLAAAAAPELLALVGMSISDMISGPKIAHDVESRAKNLTGQIPGFVQSLQTVPGLVSQLDTASPQQAAELYRQLNRVGTQAAESGLWEFLESGTTGVNASLNLGKVPGYENPQLPALYESLQPYLQARRYGMMRAQDIAAAGGVPIPGGASAADYAVSFGSQAIRNPNSGRYEGTVKYIPYLKEQYYQPGYEAQQQAIQAASNPFVSQDPYVAMLINQGALNIPLNEQWSPAAQAALSAIRPGQFQSGLAALLGTQTFNPYFNAAATGATAAPGTIQMVQVGDSFYPAPVPGGGTEQELQYT